MAENSKSPTASGSKQNSEANVSGSSAIENLSRKVQNVLALNTRHRFWETQPVGQFKDRENPNLGEGPIEPPTPLSEVRQEPYNLPSQYEWCTCDIESEESRRLYCFDIINLCHAH